MARIACAMWPGGRVANRVRGIAIGLHVGGAHNAAILQFAGGLQTAMEGTECNIATHAGRLQHVRGLQIARGFEE